MTVGNLIQLLKKYDANTQVRVGTYCGTFDCIINRTHVNIISPSDGKQCVYLECEITHYLGERIRKAGTIRKKSTEPELVQL